jgi:crotonobetainyl-CoA:carnitine CoA-transferase CaiB-like acyl-CoA transferase
VSNGPLTGVRVWEISDAPACGFAGWVLAKFGAEVTMLEPQAGSQLRVQPPFVAGTSALFSYLGADKGTRPLMDVPDRDELAGVNIIIHDRLELPSGWEISIDSAPLPERGRTVVSVCPYGASGPKRDWAASELSLFQVGGEGYLMPSGLAFSQFPDRSPIGVGRYAGSYQGGLTTALVAMAGLRSSRCHMATEWVDVSVQDAQLSLNYFVFSRYVEGTLECRANRSFSYGGVVPCADGYVEVVPLEDRQWLGLREMLGDPEWAHADYFEDPLERASHGDEINRNLAVWAASRSVLEVVRLGVEHGVPVGPYVSPEDLPSDAQFRSRGFFVDQEGGGQFPGLPVTFDRFSRSNVRPSPEATGSVETNR